MWFSIANYTLAALLLLALSGVVMIGREATTMEPPVPSPPPEPSAGVELVTREAAVQWAAASAGVRFAINATKLEAAKAFEGIGPVAKRLGSTAVIASAQAWNVTAAVAAARERAQRAQEGCAHRQAVRAHPRRRRRGTAAAHGGGARRPLPLRARAQSASLPGNQGR